MLSKFPLVPFEMVIELLSIDDLKSLSLVSTEIRHALRKQLWASIAVELSDDFLLDDATRSTFPEAATMKTTQLHLIPEPRRRSRPSCSHTNTWFMRTTLVPRPDDGKSRFESLTWQALPVVKLFMPRRLKGFSWEMGTCAPEEILSDDGILGRMHPSIRTLRLITDPTCLRYESNRLHLSKFRQLRSLSWKGPNSGLLKELGLLILNNAHHLEELELDLLDWEKTKVINGYYRIGERDSDYDSWLSAREIYDSRTVGFFAFSWNSCQRSHMPRPIFSALTTLSLSNVLVGSGLVDEINFALLRSLTLRSCPEWTSFVDQAAKLNIPLGLKALEIEDDGSWPVPPRLSTLLAFLDSFLGLESLYLSFTELIGILPPCGQIARHRDTLRRVAQYEGTIDTTLIWHPEDEPEQSSEGRASPRNPSFDLDLECLGLACELERVPGLFNHFGAMSSLKVIHLRQTMIDEDRLIRLVMNEVAETAHDTHLVAGAGDEAPDTPEDSESESSMASGIEYREEGTPQVAAQPTPSDRLLEQFTSLAKWAFGPEGPSSLKFIACGDFANGLQADKCFILSRCSEGSDGFRFVTTGRAEWNEVLHQYGDLLEACPDQPLFEWPEEQDW